MEDLFINFLGKPEGIIVSQLIAAARFTVYLSLIAFLGGGARAHRGVYTSHVSIVVP